MYYVKKVPDLSVVGTKSKHVPQLKFLKQNARLFQCVGIPIPTSMVKVGVNFWYTTPESRYWIPLNVCEKGIRYFFWSDTPPIQSTLGPYSDQHFLCNKILSSSSSCFGLRSVLVFSISSCSSASCHNLSLLLIIVTWYRAWWPLLWSGRGRNERKEEVSARTTLLVLGSMIVCNSRIKHRWVCFTRTVELVWGQNVTSAHSTLLIVAFFLLHLLVLAHAGTNTKRTANTSWIT